MKALLITEGSSHIGHGHVTRCLSLYQAFETLGLQPHLLVHGDETVGGVLHEVSYELYPWLDSWKDTRRRLKDFSVVVVDSYLAGAEVYEDVSASVPVKLFLDDYRRLLYPHGFVLNGSVYWQELSYPKTEGLTYLLGPAYTPLRRGFWKVRRRPLRKRLSRVLVTFGGDDSRNMTPTVIRLLRKEHPELELFVVVGKGFKNKEEIYSLRGEKVRLFEGLSDEGMRELMRLADLAVSAGGQTTYELARMGVPSLLVAVADNQVLNCKGWERVGFALCAGWWEDKELWKKLSEGVEKLKDHELRLKMSKAGRKLVDGKGALRVVRSLIKAVQKA
ncbi:MAG: UDP-2,4-diacetamido-2,4,6-trideoxy-beta-L-altropyranose hydrolase [Aquificaceae bacterium]|nr:UDP-2,4-diacetamido-2,4,6-trideoxy-beta-L-altropyranose hydrolase [Aquificaceae bacterium]